MKTITIDYHEGFKYSPKNVIHLKDSRKMGRTVLLLSSMCTIIKKKKQ